MLLLFYTRNNIVTSNSIPLDICVCNLIKIIVNTLLLIPMTAFSLYNYCNYDCITINNILTINNIS